MATSEPSSAGSIEQSPKIRVHHLDPTMDNVSQRPLSEGNFQTVSSKRYRLRTNSFNQETIQIMVTKERSSSFNDISERIQRLSV